MLADVADYCRGFSDYKRAQKFCEYCKWQLVKYKGWRDEYEGLYDNELALAPLAYQEFLEKDAPLAMPRKESDLRRLHKYFSRSADEESCPSDDPDDDNQPWVKGPRTALQQVREGYARICYVNESMCATFFIYIRTHVYMQLLSSAASTKKSTETETVSFEADPNVNWSVDYVSMGGPTTFSNVNGWLSEQISTHSGEVKAAAAAAVKVIDVATLTEAQAVALATVQEYERTGQQLLMIIYGTAGTGKSHLISCIKQECEGVFVMAPTAMAAMLVGGMTYQSAIPVPVNGCRTFPEISSQMREHYKELLRGVKMFILDEFSMLGQGNCGWVDLRLRQFFEVRTHSHRLYILGNRTT